MIKGVLVRARCPPRRAFLSLTLQSITVTFTRIDHPNLDQCGSDCEEIAPPDSQDDGGFCVSRIAGGLLLLAAGIGAIMSDDQRLGVNTIREVVSK